MSYSNSILCRILGLFEFKQTNTNIIIMENITPSKKSAFLFDLKGSTYDRSCLKDITRPMRGKIMKDQDFKNLNIRVDILEDDARRLYCNIREDIRMLEELGIMDYSLLIGIYDEFKYPGCRYTVQGRNGVIYRMGIIDFMQEYTLSKKAEREMKRLMSVEEISSVNPHRYAERFLCFVRNILLEENNFKSIV